MPAAVQSEAPTIRTLRRPRYEIPAGWEWTEFDGHGATIQHLATKSGEKGKETSPNPFSVRSRKTPDDAFDRGWGRLDRDQKRTFPGGAAARWKAGPRWDGIHDAFAGEARIGSEGVERGLSRHTNSAHGSERRRSRLPTRRRNAP